MTLSIQLDFFESDDELTLLQKKVDVIDTRTRNVQRGLFSRYNAFCKEILEIVERQQKEIESLRAIQVKVVK
jgi:hypothetical protein